MEGKSLLNPALRRGLFQGGRFEAIVAVLFAVATRYILDITVARTSSAEAFGQYAVIMAYGVTLSMIASGGLPELASRQIPALHRDDRPRAIRSFLRLGMVTSVCLGLILGGAAASMLRFLTGASTSSTDATLMLVVLVPVVALFSFRRQQALLCGRTHIGLFAPTIMSALSVVVVLIAAQALGMTGTIWALAAVVVSTLALSSIMGLRTAPHTSPGEPKTPSLERWGWLRTGTVIVASNVATVLTTQLDLLVIAIVATPLETGIYAAASRIALLITLALGGLVIREGPVFGRLLAAAQVAACWKEYRRACAVSGGIGIVTFALILGAGGIALSLYGPQFSQGWTWLWVLAIGRCVSAVTGPAAVLLIVMGNERSAAGAAWLGLSVGAGTMAVLGGPFGPLGIAIGASSGMVVQNITQAYLARKQIRNLGLGAANC